jgi:hypothetical protein
MKNIAITASVVGLLAFLFVADVYYMHLFSQYFIQFSEHPKLFRWSLYQFEHPKFIAILFWLGFLLTFISVLLAGLSLRGHWRSGTFIGRFCWCFALLASYISFFVIFLYVQSHTIVNTSQIFHQDPIDSIVKEASADPIFPASNTLCLEINLPATAPVAEVVTRALTETAETNVTVLETKQVQIANADKNRVVPPDYLRYTAVLVNTSSGERVILLQFQRDGNWFYRVYDLPPSV